ncbi:MAG: adenosylcobinamide-GDP ribazoletransferase [Thiovulaceae bacterium]|nr:adenosylcobinamide-GDP ribazoletransferase [Sulfurimonadaceae bacterium]
MKNILKGFALALSMLSTLPFFRVHNFEKGINGLAVMFYPLVGALLGGILLGAYLLLQPYLPLMHLMVVLFFLWIVLTGALHLDGFSDTLDGLFVSKDRSLEVMKDPHTGGMGMIFTVAFLIFKASSLIYLELIWTLPLILMLSRFNAVIAIFLLPYLRDNGMSALAKKEFRRRHFFSALVLVGMLLSFFPYIFSLIMMAVSLITFILIERFFKYRYGGMTGDIYGFLIEVTEIILLNAVIIWNLI